MLSEKQENKIIEELKAQKKTQAEIAKEVDPSESPVYRRGRQMGIMHYKPIKKRLKGEQLCWTCSKAYGGCNWSACFEPVEGWTAEPVVICPNTNHPVETYHIIECPEYEEE